jgi:hypothetical protein
MLNLPASVTRSASLLLYHLLAGQALTSVGQCLPQQHSIYAQRGIRWLTVYYALLQCYRRFDFSSTESFLVILAAQSWQTKADRSMWHIQYWVYNGNILYSYLLCTRVTLNCVLYMCDMCHAVTLNCVLYIWSFLTFSSEFWLQVSTSMADLCFDVFGIAKEKKDPKSIKGNRGTYILIHNSFLISLSYIFTLHMWKCTSWSMQFFLEFCTPSYCWAPN